MNKPGIMYQKVNTMSASCRSNSQFITNFLILKVGPLDRIFVETTPFYLSFTARRIAPLLFCADPISPSGISEINGCRLIRLNSHILQLCSLPHSIRSAPCRALFCHVMFPLLSLLLCFLSISSKSECKFAFAFRST